MGSTQAETRLARLIDERATIHRKQEAKLEEVEQRADKTLNDIEQDTLKRWREEAANLDIEVTDLTAQIEADNRAAEQSKAVRRALAGGVVEEDGDGVVYRTMAEFARDVILTSRGTEAAKIQAQLGDRQEIQAAENRLAMLKRAPDNTLSSNVGGLIPPQHIAQIFTVIDDSRPLVESAQRVDLNRGTLTYPQIDTKPVVSVQASEKTEGGTSRLAVSMQTATASTYIGGGDLSWQAINWSTPNALDLWFRVIAADYALKTETDAATVVSAAAFLDVISSPLGATPTYAELMAAIGKGGAKVYSESGKMADTIYMAPDRYWYAVGLTSDSSLNFGQTGPLQINNETVSLRVVVSRGLNAGEIIVGDSQSLLVAETPGAPVELRVVEPSIGGVEVGLIGAFEAVVVDDAFSLITTAS